MKELSNYESMKRDMLDRALPFIVKCGWSTKEMRDWSVQVVPPSCFECHAPMKVSEVGDEEIDERVCCGCVARSMGE